MVVQFGQFLDHDVAETPQHEEENCCSKGKSTECFPIPVPENDYFYSPRNVKCLEFARSIAFCEENGGAKQQLNALTHFVDASTVYGSEEEIANDLRSFAIGKLKVGKNNLLPKDETGLDMAGDHRVSEMPGLASMHTLFLREHNRICNMIQSKYPYWKDEKIYQNARRILIAEYQNVVYGEFLPAILGSQNNGDLTSVDERFFEILAMDPEMAPEEMTTEEMVQEKMAKEKMAQEKMALEEMALEEIAPEMFFGSESMPKGSKERKSRTDLLAQLLSTLGSGGQIQALASLLNPQDEGSIYDGKTNPTITDEFVTASYETETPLESASSSESMPQGLKTRMGESNLLTQLLSSLSEDQIQALTSLLNPQSSDEGSLYDEKTNPTITNEFATAAYRFGHSMIQGIIELFAIDNSGKVDEFVLHKEFGKTSRHGSFKGKGFEESLMGLMNQPSQSCDKGVSIQVTNFLFPDETGKDFGGDLVARNIQRGRDHGLPGFCCYYKLYDDKNFDCKSGWSKRYNGFSPENWALLQTIYKNPSDIDLFTGGLTQEPQNNGLLGNVFNRMIGNYIKDFLFSI